MNFHDNFLANEDDPKIKLHLLRGSARLKNSTCAAPASIVITDEEMEEERKMLLENGPLSMRENIHSGADDALDVGTLLVFLEDILSSVLVGFFTCFPCTNTHAVATSRVRNSSSWPEHLALRLSKDTDNEQ